MNCIHRPQGLCPACQEEYDADPLAWLEFGQHAQGIANWRAEEERMKADRAELDQHPAVSDDSLPF